MSAFVVDGLLVRDRFPRPGLLRSPGHGRQLGALREEALLGDHLVPETEDGGKDDPALPTGQLLSDEDERGFQQASQTGISPSYLASHTPRGVRGEVCNEATTAPLSVAKNRYRGGRCSLALANWSGSVTPLARCVLHLWSSGRTQMEGIDPRESSFQVPRFDRAGDVRG
jgi:hypothetical protein